MAIPLDENHRNKWIDILGEAGTGAIRLSLLFGSAAIALTVILTPMAENQVARSIAAPVGIDQMATGSTQASRRAGPETRNYILRRSVLQSGKDDVCIISSNGMRTGSC
ncbi:MAG: hypothetical protein ACRCT6_08515 [Notoacmeibacter sp.]